ncbi:MAG: glycoside hydrolase family 57 protein [Bacillota bacterium]
MPDGLVMLVFHAHLPYVRHPELNYCLEENWFFEAITETYIPLLMIFEQLVEDNVNFKITLTMTPTLMSMLKDDFLQERFRKYLSSRLELANKEKIRTWGQPGFHCVARWYRARLQEIEHYYHNLYRGDLLNAFRKFSEMGKLEILTCAATHGFLPLLQGQPQAVRAQLQVGVDTYRDFMGRSPQGIWLPECAYYPGLEKILHQVGLRYFFLDTKGVTEASPTPPWGVFTPLMTDNQIAAFGREAETSRQVWCAQTGYPGDPVYRDFYRDLGFDLDMDYIGPYVDPAGIRIFTGFKYYQVTGKTDQKQPYNPQIALERARHHAEHFAESLVNRARQLKLQMNRQPLIVSAYDAELLGHWWFEGPNWLEHLLRTLDKEGKVETATGPEYLSQYPDNPIGRPAVSSWGDQGYYSTWLNNTNDWIYPHLYAAGEQMSEMVRRYPNAAGSLQRVLNQALRELLLAQSSDWAFIINNQTAAEYAERRTKEHLHNFRQLYLYACSSQLTETLPIEVDTLLTSLEAKNNLFPKIDYRVFRES